ncbi:MAG: methionyl-tRNA formyltransferase [Candidatus Omnitrophica bacterium]|nr:methionyl-tRNA formyltransferase [Candidatus Omnitrophota bacterium]
MKIVFFGSSHFAVSSLEALIKSGYDIACVVTQPDKKKGRHLHLASTCVKTLAEAAGIDVFQPQDINTNDSVNHLKAIGADLFVIVAYGQILSQPVLDLPGVMAVNIHASLLPKYRGAAPINWAIIKGEEITGVTIMRVERRMDCGPVISQKEISINEDDTAISLEISLSRLGGELLLETVKNIKNVKLFPQNDLYATYASKLKKSDGLIDWKKTAIEIYNLVRGTLPWPGAFTYYNSKLVKIYIVEKFMLFDKKDFSCGEIVEILKDGIVVVAGKGAVIIKELQIEGKRRMTAAEFIAGHKVSVGESLLTKK